MAGKRSRVALGEPEAPALAELVVHMLDLGLAPALSLQGGPDHRPLALREQFTGTPGAVG